MIVRHWAFVLFPSGEGQAKDMEGQISQDLLYRAGDQVTPLTEAIGSF